MSKFKLNTKNSKLFQIKWNVWRLNNTTFRQPYIYQQLNAFFENKPSRLLCGFRSRYSTQHALLNLINKWHSYLDNSGVVGTILMDLSKAFDCLAHELTLAKLHAYRVDIKSLKLLQDYLSNGTQRVKLDSTFSSWLKILLGVP